MTTRENTYLRKWPIWPIYDFWSRLLFFIKNVIFPYLQVKERLLSHQGYCRPHKEHLEWKNYVKQGAGGAPQSVHMKWAKMTYISYDPFSVFVLYILPPTALRASHGVRSWEYCWGHLREHLCKFSRWNIDVKASFLCYRRHCPFNRRLHCSKLTKYFEKLLFFLQWWVIDYWPKKRWQQNKFSMKPRWKNPKYIPLLQILTMTRCCS